MVASPSRTPPPQVCFPLTQAFEMIEAFPICYDMGYNVSSRDRGPPVNIIKKNLWLLFLLGSNVKSSFSDCSVSLTVQLHGGGEITNHSKSMFVQVQNKQRKTRWVVEGGWIKGRTNPKLVGAELGGGSLVGKEKQIQIFYLFF